MSEHLRIDAEGNLLFHRRVLGPPLAGLPLRQDREELRRQDLRGWTGTTEILFRP
jgi:hypothetical protein